MSSFNLPKNRFDLDGCEQTMKAVVTTGNGGYDKLEYSDVPVPVPETEAEPDPDPEPEAEPPSERAATPPLSGS